MSDQELNVVMKLAELHANSWMTLWNYYFVVMVGVITIIGASLGSKGTLGDTTAIFLIGAICVFGTTNLLSIWQISTDLVALDGEVRAALDKSTYKNSAFFGWSAYLQPIGWLGTSLFVWMKR